MNTQWMTRCGAHFVMSAGVALSMGLGAEAAAQERCKMTLDTPGANSEYTEQHVMDVGDVAGHQIRIFELHRTFPDDNENCEGIKRVEQWTHGYSDYVDRNGRAWGYSVIELDNGDKIFAQWSGTSHTVIGEDGSKKSSYTGVTNWIGGTGKYQNVRGISRESVAFDPEKNFNESHAEVEYWFDK
jgi:hypothetical protein